jgi:transposase-like protein
MDKYGDTVDFLLTKRRMKESAQKFFNKTIANNQNPRIINIDKRGSNFTAIRPVTEIISGIKTSKLGGVNTLIIVLNSSTEK